MENGSRPDSEGLDHAPSHRPLTLRCLFCGRTVAGGLPVGRTGCRCPIQVGWTGPDLQNDYIGICRTDRHGPDAWENYAYTREGSPLNLQMHDEPGDYVLTYFVGQDRSVLATAPIRVE